MCIAFIIFSKFGERNGDANSRLTTHQSVEYFLKELRQYKSLCAV